MLIPLVLAAVAGTDASPVLDSALTLNPPEQTAPATPAQTAAPAPAAAPADAPVADVGAVKGTFLLSDKRFHSDPEIGWKGLLSGLRGFENFYAPVGNPLYFENPINDTELRALYLHHDFSGKSQLQGGHVNIWALQARIALTERLGFIATKDGYSSLHSGLLPHEEGWNDIAAGFKYVVYVDREHDAVGTVGFRYQGGNGDAKVLQGSAQEWSPFISAAKGWGKFHLIGNLTDRVPTDKNKGNNVLQWDIHTDYEVCKGVAPILELHGLHYLSNGNALPLSVGGADYSNIGSQYVSGSTVIWLGAGLRVKFTPQVSVGATWEQALTNEHADIFKDRLTVDLILSW